MNEWGNVYCTWWMPALRIILLKKKKQNKTTTTTNPLVTLPRKVQGLSVLTVFLKWHKCIKPPTCSVNIRLYLLAKRMMTDDVLVMKGGTAIWVSSLPSSSTLSLSISSLSGPYFGISKWRLSASKFLHSVHKVQCKPNHLLNRSIHLTPQFDPALT